MDRAEFDLEIGIVNTSNAALLRQCLDSIPSACGGLGWRTTVLDNASTDGSAEMIAAEYPWVRLIRNDQKLGFAVTLNQMVQPMVDEETGPYVALVHEDVELLPGTLEELVRAADAETAIGLIGPAIVDGAGNPQHSFLAFPTVGGEARLGLFPGRMRPRATDVGWLDGPCLVLRLAALRQVGLFDERFFIYFEDVDISLRMHRAGWKVSQLSSAGIVHRRHGSTGNPGVAGRMELQILRSRFLYFQKHHGTAVAVALARWLQLTFWLRSAKAAVTARLGAGGDEALLSKKLADLARFYPGG